MEGLEKWHTPTLDCGKPLRVSIRGRKYWGDSRGLCGILSTNTAVWGSCVLFRGWQNAGMRAFFLLLPRSQQCAGPPRTRRF